MPRIEIVVSDLEQYQDQYATEITVGAELPEALTADELSARLRDLSMALMVAMTYHPNNVRDAFEGE